jgi:hypothetical protein
MTWRRCFTYTSRQKLAVPVLSGANSGANLRLSDVKSLELLRFLWQRAAFYSRSRIRPTPHRADGEL